jgi:antitoxin (DNA-binding transcriptional repressor) of toxin-antitoxin stability system
VDVRELKDRLSQYLREVRAGETKARQPLANQATSVHSRDRPPGSVRHSAQESAANPATIAVNHAKSCNASDPKSRSPGGPRATTTHGTRLVVGIERKIQSDQ